MNHGSLFSGIGGFDLAAEWMGWNNVFHCEWNEFGKRVLNYYWPDAISYDDICKTDFTIWRGRIDILTGGFPCQPFSVAGKRKGTEDARHLWPEMLRAIRECKPTWIVGENVPGLINWSKGLVFEQVCADLESEGYEVQPVILPACGVGAPHRRDRVWIVANHNNTGARERSGINGHGSKENKGRNGQPQFESWQNGEHGVATNSGLLGSEVGQFETMGIEQLRKEPITADTESNKDKRRRSGRLQSITTRINTELNANTNDTRLEGSEIGGSIGGSRAEQHKQPAGFFRTDWQDFPTVSPLLSGNDGISSRLDGITISKWRNESIKAAGNAIVPQVAYEIFKVIDQIENDVL